MSIDIPAGCHYNGDRFKKIPEQEGEVIKGAFLLRRKTLSNSLSAALPGWDKAAIADAIAACGLPASVRGEALTLTEFAALTDALAERK